MDRVTAFLDSNVLYPAGLRNLLMRLAVRRLFRARWSEMVHEEWMVAVLRDFPDLTREQLKRTRDLMNRHAEASLVRGFEHLIDGLDLPDPDDRHVLAAAIRTSADVIVTRNLRDFPQSQLDPYGIDAQHPDAFIMQLFESNPEEVFAAAQEHRGSLRNPPTSVEEYLGMLSRQGLTRTTAALRDHPSGL